HAVAVPVHVLCDLAVGREGAGHDEGDVVPTEDIRDAIADAGLQARVGDRGEAPQRPVVVGRLLGVPDPELDVVDAVQGQEVLRLLVGVLVEVGAGLIGGALGDGVAGNRVGHRTAAPVLQPGRGGPVRAIA